MMGVVLWSDHDNGKAVIWCEDQGKLAYVTGEQAEITADLDLQAGDLVSFSLRMQSRLRFAENLSIVEENSYEGIDDALRAKAGVKPAAVQAKVAEPAKPVLDQGAEIIPFRAKAPQRPSGQPLAAQVGA